MTKVSVSFYLALLLPVFISSSSQQEVRITSGTDARACSFVIRACKSKCSTEPRNYVRWTVGVVTPNVTCVLQGPAIPTADPGGSPYLFSEFDVPCCTQPPSQTAPPCPTLQCPTPSSFATRICPPPRPCTNSSEECSCPQPQPCPTSPTANCPPAKPCPDRRAGEGCPCLQLPQPTQSDLSVVCLDDRKLLHTLFILGVATLTSILLMCIFVFLGLIFYRKKNGAYRLDGSSEENHSLTKENEKTLSTTLTLSDCHDNNTPTSSSSPSTSSHNLPPKYQNNTPNTADKLNDQADYENTDPVGCSSAERNRLSNQEYVNHEDVVAMSNAAAPRSIKIRKDNFDGTASEKSKVTTNSKPQVSSDFEIRGGFIQPKRTSNKSETQTTRLDEKDTSNADMSLSDDIALHLETSQNSMSLFPELTDTDENPYVEAPPIKSPRNQTQFESPDAYQTLMPSNPNHTDETNEYNLFLRDSAVANNDMKALLFMNNNSHQQTNGVNNKSEVVLKPTPTITAASEA